MKYVFITGGVLSGLGKGIVAASLGRILISRGYKVSAIKIDPYLNQDAGTMNPVEHGEVFVLDDGGEVDMDFGHYERFLGGSLSSDHNITTGKVFQKVLDKERKGDYLGQTVQIVPHVINEIKATIREIAKREDPDIQLVEIGGTVGDIEAMSFLEATRQMKAEEPGNVLVAHLTLVPQLSVVGEQKSKPTQHSVRFLRDAGIAPDLIIGRSTHYLTDKIKRKIALFCNVKEDAVISNPDASTIYAVPLILDKEGLGDLVLRRLRLRKKRARLGEWKRLVKRIKNAKKHVTIALTGKYMKLHDSYVSVEESLVHAGAALGLSVDLVWIDTEEFEKDPKKIAILDSVDGIIVPGGYGSRGIEGKIMAVKYARQKKVPYLGLCYGLQMAVIEYARNVAGLKDAHTTEVNPKTPYPVITIQEEQKTIEQMGGTNRLGAYKARLTPGSLANKLYDKQLISERHRHRYEVNPEYIPTLEAAGLKFTGRNPGRDLVEIIELPGQFFIASQFHPELKSRLDKPSPLFVGFLKAASRRKK